MAIIANEFAGPGTGKSTNAALLYAFLKMEGVNCELVREYVKDWAWEGRIVGAYDQFYFLGKQIRKESMLLKKVDVIITDSPVAMSSFYSAKFAPVLIAAGVDLAVRAYLDQLEADGHQVLNLWLNRTKAYNPAGRYQSEEEARQIDVEMRAFFERRGYHLREASTEAADTLALAKEIATKVRESK